MLIKVKTLTGKEIEIDIEPTDKVERIKVNLWMTKLTNNIFKNRSAWKKRKESLHHSSVSSSPGSR